MKTGTILLIILGLVLAAGLGVAAYFIFDHEPAPAAPVPSAPATTAAAPETEPTEPLETTPPTEITTVPTTEPLPEEYTLTFAGDCTFAQAGFVSKVGDDYTYPFLDVQPWFANDDCTFINLECTLSNRGKQADKTFTFRGKPEYVNILTEGSVEFASLANNHSMDYGQTAYDDTKALLEEAGVYYGESAKTTLIELERGLKIGVLSLYFPSNNNGIASSIQSLRDEGAQIVVVCVHWGLEYYFKPDKTQVNVAHYAIDNGADIVYGHHPHVLQPIEEYNGGIIYYSLANFSFGGNSRPADMDTAIIQQKLLVYPDGTAELSETVIVPCYVSGTPKSANDYQPTPIDQETDAEGWERVMAKLSGTYGKDKIVPSYRNDLNGSQNNTQPEDKEEETTTPPAGGDDTPSDDTPSGGDTPSDDTPSGGDTPSDDTPSGGGSGDGGGTETPPPSQEPPAEGGGTE